MNQEHKPLNACTEYELITELYKREQDAREKFTACGVDNISTSGDIEIAMEKVRKYKFATKDVCMAAHTFILYSRMLRRAIFFERFLIKKTNDHATEALLMMNEFDKKMIDKTLVDASEMINVEIKCSTCDDTDPRCKEFSNQPLDAF